MKRPIDEGVSREDVRWVYRSAVSSSPFRQLPSLSQSHDVAVVLLNHSDAASHIVSQRLKLITVFDPSRRIRVAQAIDVMFTLAVVIEVASCQKVIEGGSETCRGNQSRFSINDHATF